MHSYRFHSERLLDEQLKTLLLRNRQPVHHMQRTTLQMAVAGAVAAFAAFVLAHGADNGA
jgi:hypothetical protein